MYAPLQVGVSRAVLAFTHALAVEEDEDLSLSLVFGEHRREGILFSQLHDYGDKLLGFNDVNL